MTDVFPLKPGDWVSDSGDRVARVKKVYRDLTGTEGALLVDLIMYDRRGEKIGRVSPYCGGPRTFEPCMTASDWRRIAEPEFPLSLKWVPDGSGRNVARYWTGETLPPANWTPKPRRSRYALKQLANDRFKKALKEIAAGHNDARQLAKDTLSHS